MIKRLPRADAQESITRYRTLTPAEVRQVEEAEQSFDQLADDDRNWSRDHHEGEHMDFFLHLWDQDED